MTTRRRLLLFVCVCLVLAGCGGDAGDVAIERESTSTTSASTTIASTATTEPATDPYARPEWLGTRVLPEGPGGFGEVQPTPSELDPRALRPPEHLPDPPDDTFRSTIAEVPDDVLVRSTWEPGCPVEVDELRYVTVDFYGFDEEFHAGELLINAAHAEGIVSVFEAMHAARFPIEEMSITSPEELDLPPTGDGNNTSAFVCRAVRGGTNYSQHAYGLAIDVNPFHNPYVKGEIVLPELASTYVDRSNVRPGMLTRDGVAVRAFRDTGWEWGGAWTGSVLDNMHFSANGR